MGWKCNECAVEYDGNDDVCQDDPRVHDEEQGIVQCPNGHGDMTWSHAVAMVRAIDATFDYAFQVFRDSDGNVVPMKEDWDFSCPKCHGPAKMTSCTAHYEYHRCLECGKGFEVK